jgi:uncharacterized protein GlcG (DUF336 family)
MSSFETQQNLIQTNELPLSSLIQIVNLAAQIAKDLKVQVWISYTNPNLLNTLCVRLGDNTYPDSKEIAQNKSMLSASRRKPTELIACPTAQQLGLAGVKGGLPIWTGSPTIGKNVFLGGIGVSGGSEDEDKEIVEQSVRSFDLRTYTI